MLKPALTGLHWFRHDLRTMDNQPLFENNRLSHTLLCVFVVDPRWFKSGHFQSAHLGKHRWRFLFQSLLDLDQQLQRLGQRLIVRFGDPVAEIQRLLDAYQVAHLSFTHHSGVYERQQVQRVKHHNPQLTVMAGQGHSLFCSTDLPFALNDVPATFKLFRKQVEALPIDRPIQACSQLTPPPKNVDGQWPENLPARTAKQSSAFDGASQAGHQQLQYYLFESQRVSCYKQTRNDLDGWDGSSKLSPWLANGSLSIKQVYSALKRFESQYGGNESSAWLYCELLWREYFYWYANQHGSLLFAMAGVKQKKPLTTFWPLRFARWCEAATPFPIVNACMAQLNETGYMSNRGRQLVARALVHELNLDWRYGAAYFEQQLIDFDVASNYGNWQYLAGVGGDPRGLRRFDLQKQTRQYDPEGAFIAKWRGEARAMPLDDVDQVDWPVT